MVSIWSTFDLLKKVADTTDDVAQVVFDIISGEQIGIPRLTTCHKPKNVHRSICALEDIQCLHICRDELPIGLRPVYNTISEGLKSFDDSIELGISIKDIPMEDIMKAYTAVTSDSPLYYYSSHEISCRYNSREVWLCPKYRYSYEETIKINQQMQNVARKIGTKIDDDEFSTEEAVNKYLISNVKYENLPNCLAQYCDVALIQGKAVCKGFTMAASFLLNTLGIKCGTVQGILKESGEAHAWNVVVLNGKRYHIDMTNNRDASNRFAYNYYNMSDEQLSKTHSWTANTRCNDSSKARAIGW